MKIDRQAVYDKYDGHCAYCGREINIKSMEVEHIKCKFLSKLYDGSVDNSIGNLNPACRKCNRHKGGMRLEVWRKELGLQVARLRKNAQFDRALRFGQIKITESPVKFFFEQENVKDRKPIR